MLRLLTLIVVIAALLTTVAHAGNDDSCDVGVTPAATLLLPYFEVDYQSRASVARTTTFTVTNVSALPQIAHVTLWTDWAYAVLNFNIFLTPYGTQSISLYDVFARGVIAPGAAHYVSQPTLGPHPSNPNFNVTPGSPGNVASTCASAPATLSPAVLADLQQIFTYGVAGASLGSGCRFSHVGSDHGTSTDFNRAIGYVTIDVVNTCTSSFPGPQYFASEVLFDNVLIGDYETVNADTITGNYAGGNPMVHIRAMPEGGPAGSTPGTNLPYTFYDRYTATTPQTLPRSIDRRQPLPSMFAARWIDSGGGFISHYQIWREGLTGPSSTSCSPQLPSANSALSFAEIVRFDEHENSGTYDTSPCINECVVLVPTLPAASSNATSSEIFPGLTRSGDLGGWMYLNLSAGNAPAYGSHSRASQNWVTVNMEAEGRYAVLFDAAQLGNGCSPPASKGTLVGPVGGVPVCPSGAQGCVPGFAPYTGTNVNPVLPP